MPSPGSGATYRFLDFELDVPAYELRHQGKHVRLERQPMDILILLVEHRRQLVSRSTMVERLWGQDVFVDVETGINTAIRKIRHVLSDPSDAPSCVETVPGKGYRFIAPVEVVCGHGDVTSLAPPELSAAGLREPTVPPAAQSVPANVQAPALVRQHRTLVAVGAMGAVVLAMVGVALLRTPPTVVAPPMRVAPLTTLTGDEYSPTFSPDGRQVAFSWNGETEDNFDIYVKLVGAPAIRRVTSDPKFDGDPNWSPDGKQIAFVRCWWGESGCRIYLTSPLGGSELKLSELPINEADPARYSKISWSPDGRYLAASVAQPAHPGSPSKAGIYLVPATGGAARPLIEAQAAMWHISPAFAPDGRHLAYASCNPVAQCDVDVIDLDASLRPTGSARRLTDQRFAVGKIAWSRDGRSIVYDGQGMSFVNHLWRIGLDGPSLPERMEAAGFARLPATTMAGDRLAFTEWRIDLDIYRFESDGPSQPLLTSSFLDWNPVFSPDGHRIAFSSGRAAETPEIWLASADGQGAYQLTHGPGLSQLYPAWSPDGRQIVFASTADDGHSHLWTIDATGGAPRQLTRDAGDQNAPVWSRDGRWIYFTADDGRGRDIWRIPAAGGSKMRVTHGGSSLVVQESADGRSLFYTLGDALLTVPATGGRPHQVVPCVKGGGFAVGVRGVYYATCNFAFELDTALHVMDPETGRDRLLGTLKDYWAELAVSPDEKTILYRKAVNRGLHRRFSVGADLMLMENFR
jgi:eukaryotic-like serine/threonine-protein kinase